MSARFQIPLLQKGNNYSWRSLTVANSQDYPIPLCVNGYYESSPHAVSDSRKVAYCKRPGLGDATTVTEFTNLVPTNSGERVNGLCTSLDKNILLYYSYDATKRYTNIYTASTNTLTQTDVTATFAAGNMALTVLDGINYGANVYYAATNGTEGALINSSGVWSKITDADYTGNGVKTNFVGLDGYLFYGVISGTNAGRIYNSDLSAAAAASGWTDTSYISANDVPGSIVWLARIRNMVVCFKQYSIEFFEDVGNPIPGSPLERRSSVTKHIGCASASSVQEVSDGIIFLAVDKRGKMRYMKLRESDLELEPISDPYIDFIVSEAVGAAGGFPSFGNDFDLDGDVRGQSQVIVMYNKEFYTTNISVDDETANDIGTFVYDNELKVWYQWASASASIDGVKNFRFYGTQSFSLKNSNGGLEIMFVNNNTGNAKSSFRAFWVNSANANAYKDATAATHYTYVFEWMSDYYDFGNVDRKFMHSVEVHYDADWTDALPAASTSTLTLTHYEADINQPVASKSVTIDSSGFRRAKYRQLGSFRRKAFKLSEASGYPLRLWAVEVVYDSGPDDA